VLPSECNMPDVSDLLASPAQKPFLTHQLMGAEADFPEKMLAYRRNFVRLADKAARDYADVRKCVLSLIQKQKSGTLEIMEGRLLVSFTTDRLEDCIITVRRLFKYFERIKSDPTQFPLDRLFKRRVATLENSIVDVRDLIIHLGPVHAHIVPLHAHRHVRKRELLDRHAELADRLVEVWNRDNVGKDHHPLDQFERAQPLAQHRRQQRQFQQHDQQPREHDTRCDADRQP
jgi:hypothetical protein